MYDFSFLIYLDAVNIIEFRAAMKRFEKDASPEERIAIENVLHSLNKLAEYTLFGNSEALCKMLLGYGFEESKKLQEVATHPALREAIAALNDNLEAGQQSIKQDCSMENIRKITTGNQDAFNAALKGN